MHQAFCGRARTTPEQPAIVAARVTPPGSRVACAILPRMTQPPERKISETVIDFGEPLVSELDSGMPIEVIRSVFEMVITVWNAHVTAMPRWGRPQFLADLERRLDDPQMPPEVVAALRTLSSRRSLPRFVSDDRAVGEWSLVGGAEGWRLRCDAREPSTTVCTDRDSGNAHA
jgi:hypothetical protein